MYSEFYFGIFTIFGKFIWQRVHLVYKVTQPKVNLTHFAFYPNKFKVRLQKMIAECVLYGFKMRTEYLWSTFEIPPIKWMWLWAKMTLNWGKQPGGNLTSNRKYLSFVHFNSMLGGSGYMQLSAHSESGPTQFYFHCLVFLHCVYCNVSTNCLLDRMPCWVGCKQLSVNSAKVVQHNFIFIVCFL